MERDRIQRYSIRKLSVGAASVLIGMGFAGATTANQADAATVDTNQIEQTENAATQNADSNKNSTLEIKTQSEAQTENEVKNENSAKTTTEANTAEVSQTQSDTTAQVEQDTQELPTQEQTSNSQVTKDSVESKNAASSSANSQVQVALKEDIQNNQAEKQLQTLMPSSDAKGANVDDLTKETTTSVSNQLNKKEEKKVNNSAEQTINTLDTVDIKKLKSNSLTNDNLSQNELVESKVTKNVATTSDGTEIDPAQYGYIKTGAGWTISTNTMATASSSKISLSMPKDVNRTLKQDEPYYDVTGSGTIDADVLKDNSGKKILLASIPVIETDQYRESLTSAGYFHTHPLTVALDDGTSLKAGDISISACGGSDWNIGGYDSTKHDNRYEITLNVTATPEQLAQFADEVTFDYDISGGVILQRSIDSYEGFTDMPVGYTHDAYLITPDNEVYTDHINHSADEDTLKVFTASDNHTLTGNITSTDNRIWLNNTVTTNLDNIQDSTVKKVAKITSSVVDEDGKEIAPGFNGHDLDAANGGHAYDFQKQVFKGKDGKLYQTSEQISSMSGNPSINQKKVDDDLDANTLYNMLQPDEILISYQNTDHSYLIAWSLNSKTVLSSPNYDETNKRAFINSYEGSVIDPAKLGYNSRQEMQDDINKQFSEGKQYYAMLEIKNSELDNNAKSYNKPFIVTSTDITPESDVKIINQATYTPDGTKVNVNYYANAPIYYIDKDTKQNISNDITKGVKGKTSNVKFTVPTGYEFAPDQADNEDHIFTGTATDHIDVYVVASNQTIPISYVDDLANQKEVGTDSFIAKTATDYTYVANKIPTGYQLASDQPAIVTGTVKPTDNKITIHLVHAKKEVSQNNGQLVRTVTVTNPDGSTKQVSNKTYKIKRTGMQDDITGTIEWNPWSTTNVDAVEIPYIDGYTAYLVEGDKSLANTNGKGALTITKEEFTGDNDNTDKIPNITENFKVAYRANSQVAHVIFTDKTTGKQLDARDLEGKSGTTSVYDPTETINAYIKDGYKLDKNDIATAGGKVVFDKADEGDQTYYIDLSHVLTPVNESHTATRTVTYTYKGGVKAGQKAANDNVSTVTFNRTGKRDEVTKQIAWDKWTPGDTANLAAVTIPTIKGYTADHSNIAVKAVTPANADSVKDVVQVNYTPDKQVASIIFYDDTNNGEKLFTKDLSGVTDQKQNYDPTNDIKVYTDKYYDVVSNNYPKGGFVLDNDDNKDQVFEVHFKHHIATVTDPTMLTATFDRTVTTHTPDGKSSATKQHYVINRTGTQDLVTKKYTFTNWSTAQVHEDKGSVLDGYTAKINSATPGNITSINKDGVPIVKAETFTNPNDGTLTAKNVVESVDLGYTANNQKVIVNYIDDTTNKTLETKNLVGKSNSDSGYTTEPTIKNYLEKGYDLVSDDTAGKSIKYDAHDKVDQVYNVHLKHHISPVTDQKMLTATFKRTVIENLPDGKTKEIRQFYDIHRVGAQDQVTKEYTFSKWSTAPVNEDVGDVLDGYTTTITSQSPKNIASINKDGAPVVKAEVFTNPDNNSTTPKNVKENIELGYTANTQKATVNYIDDTDNKTLASKGLEGKSNSDSGYTTADTIKDYIAKGYDLVSDDTNGKSVQFDAHDKVDQVYNVHLKHRISDVTDNRILNATFDRVITENIPGSKPKEIKQHYVITRTGKQDQVTKAYTFGDWSVAQVTEDKGDKVTGYTAQIDAAKPEDFITLVDGVPTAKAEQFTNENGKLLPKNTTETATINYVANPESAQLTYVDDTTGQNLQSVTTNGKYADTIVFTPDVDTVIKDYEGKGYVLVSNDFKNQTYGDGANNFTVHLAHGTRTVSRSTTANEVIHYVYQDGSKALDDYQATPITFTDEGTQDLVTGETVWNNNYTPVNGTFAAVESPTIDGYSPDKASIDAQTVDSNSGNLAFTVTYVKDPEPMVPSEPIQPSEASTTPVEQPTMPVEEPVTEPTVEKIATNTEPVEEKVETEPTKKKVEIILPKVEKQAQPTEPKENELPQTGTKDESKLGIIGAAVAGIAGVFGLGAGKKKKED
ncbi:YSIRK-type signal peptide-containing protein [Lactobacillus sp.]|uniref:mucin-binding protein n=1 Tax=Lactobacillus sp. TaxID=1591 RepID=UPI0019AFD4BD|nr:YSIRK-type signal peptide-containing protein [Lactobacillus sp.]MBD5430516.1 YSIRK-type signal peptide-containing protein [Lactobacillus sp.]MBD5430807.1 YSIRK-type signal peptide-containing protein [Lactobacillus sp.]